MQQVIFQLHIELHIANAFILHKSQQVILHGNIQIGYEFIRNVITKPSIQPFQLKILLHHREVHIHVHIEEYPLTELVGEMPPTFEPGAWLACRVADGVHRAVVLEAERRGLIRSGVVGEIYAEAMPPQQDEQRTPSVPPPSVRFVNGRLLPR